MTLKEVWKCDYDRGLLAPEATAQRVEYSRERLSCDFASVLANELNESAHVGALDARGKAHAQAELPDCLLLAALTVANRNWVAQSVDTHLVEGDTLRTRSSLNILERQRSSPRYTQPDVHVSRTTIFDSGR